MVNLCSLSAFYWSMNVDVGWCLSTFEITWLCSAIVNIITNHEGLSKVRKLLILMPGSRVIITDSRAFAMVLSAKDDLLKGFAHYSAVRCVVCGSCRTM
jgi:hypothetical protein